MLTLQQLRSAALPAGLQIVDLKIRWCEHTFFWSPDSSQQPQTRGRPLSRVGILLVPSRSEAL